VDLGLVRSYLPSDGGAPRLVAVLGGGAFLRVWDTGTGTLLQALEFPQPGQELGSLVTYQRPSDDRPRVAAGSDGGHLCIWDGDDFQLVHDIVASAAARPVSRLAVYEEPVSGSTRLVSA
jgi:WD40 repeat protein